MKFLKPNKGQKSFTFARGYMKNVESGQIRGAASSETLDSNLKTVKLFNGNNHK